MLIPPIRAHHVLGWSWKVLPEFQHDYFMVEQVERWALWTKLRGAVQYRVIHVLSNLVVSECVSFSGLVDDWNLLVSKTGSEKTTPEELYDIGFTEPTAQVAMEHAKHHPLAYMQSLVLIPVVGEAPAVKSSPRPMSRLRNRVAQDLSGTTLLRPRPAPRTAEHSARGFELLEMLLQKGFLDDREYAIRRQQLLKMNQTEQCKTRAKDKDKDHWMAEAFPHKKPRPEPATLWRYDAKLKHWDKAAVEIHLSPAVYAKGSMRLAYRMKIPTEPKGKQEFIAKQFINVDDDDNERYFTDVLMQSLCQEYAREFNARDPPKKVQFIDACIVELIGRKCKPDGWNQLMAVEPYMPGEYQKYNNNFGWVSYLARSTPQAFSHFTYVLSNGQHLVTDVQGVGDMYTDPQIHSSDEQGFGEGNYGRCGIEKFFSTHHCNRVCQYLHLPAQQLKGPQETGRKEPSEGQPGGASVGSTQLPPTLPRAPRTFVGRPSALSIPLTARGTGTSPRASVRKGARRPAAKGEGEGEALEDTQCQEDVLKKHPGLDLDFYSLTPQQFVQVVAIFEAHCGPTRTVTRDHLLPILRDLGIDAPLEELADMVVHLDKNVALTFEEFLCWWTGVEPKGAVVASDATPGAADPSRLPDTPRGRTPAELVASLSPRTPRSARDAPRPPAGPPQLVARF